MNRENESKRKRGRPVGKDGGRYNQVVCLLTDDELMELREACMLHGKSQSEIMRNGMKKEINLMKYQQNQHYMKIELALYEKQLFMKNAYLPLYENTFLNYIQS